MEFVSGIAILLALGIAGDAKTLQPDSVESTDGETVRLPCNHTTISGNEYIHWYRQVPLQGPEYMIHGLQQNTTNSVALLAIASDRKSSTLILPHVSLRDAAVYHCILRVAHYDRQGCTCAISAWWGKGSSGIHLKMSRHSAEDWEDSEEPRRDSERDAGTKQEQPTVVEGWTCLHGGWYHNF